MPSPENNPMTDSNENCPPVRKLIDHYCLFDDAQAARDYFEIVMKYDDLYCASIVITIDSTDYDNGAFAVVWTDEREEMRC